jgi:hypothetical protein
MFGFQIIGRVLSSARSVRCMGQKTQFRKPIAKTWVVSEEGTEQPPTVVSRSRDEVEMISDR